MPRVMGTHRVLGTVIEDFGVEERSTETSTGGKGGGPSTTQVTYEGFWTAAISFHDGEIDGYRRIWLDGKLVYDARPDADIPSVLAAGGVSAAERFLAGGQLAEAVEFHLGTADQDVSPTLEALRGVGNVSAYRNTAYIVLKAMPLGDFFNQRPRIIEAEVVRGGVISAPIRITEFDPPIDTDKLEYSQGLFRVASFDLNQPNAADTTHTINTYNLRGELVDTETYVGSNINGATNVGIARIDGIPEIGRMLQEAAGSGPTTSTWWVWRYGGGEGLLIPAAPQPWSPLGEIGNTSELPFDYRNAIQTGVFWQGHIYAVNGGDNDSGIARYGFSASSNFEVPLTVPDLFFSLTDYIGEENNSAAVSLHVGDDGFLYVIRRAGLGPLDTGDDVLVLTPDLQIANTFDLPGNVPANANIAAHGGRLAIANANEISEAGIVSLYDIRQSTLDANGNEAVLLGTRSHDAPIASLALTGIGGGLFIMDDGVWSMHDQVEVDDPTLREVVEEICLEAGLTLSDIDATDLTPTVHGYKRDQPMTARAWLEGLVPAFQFDAFESGGKIKFKLRGGASELTIPSTDLGAYEGTPPDSVLPIQHRQELELPSELHLLYNNLDNDYQIGARLYRRIITTTKHKLHLQSAVVMTPGEAQRALDIFTRALWYERDTFRSTLPPAYQLLEPATNVTLTGPLGDVLVRITSTLTLPNGIVQFEGVADISTLYSSVEVDDDATTGNQGQLIEFVGRTKLQLIDNVILRTADDSPGYYLVASGYYTGWRGGVVTRTINGVEQVVGALTIAAPCGTTSGSLNDTAFLGVDVHSRVSVRLIGGGTLSSITEAQFLAGTNAAMIGQELVYFRDVTLESDGSYTVTRFVRGVGGTPMTDHELSERFVVLSAAAVLPVDGALSDTGAAATFDATSFGDASATPYTITATLANGRIKPNAPAHAYANRQANGDYVGRFVRSARLNTKWLNSIDVPLDEPTEAYTVIVFDGATEVRTIAVGSEKTFRYTNAQQVADFGEVQTSVDFGVAMVSDRVGRGKLTYFTGIGPGISISPYSLAVLADAPIGFWPLASNILARVGSIDLTNPVGTNGVNYEFSAEDAVTDGGGSLRWITGTARFNCVDVDVGALGDTVSFEFLFKTSVSTGGSTMQLMNRGDYGAGSGSGDSWYISLPNSDRDDVRFEINPAGSDALENVRTVGAGINDGAWHHCVCVWDNPATGGTNKKFIYIDGAEAISAACSAGAGVAIQDNSTSCEIMGSSSGAAQLQGSLYGRAWYNYALSPAQVLAHFNATGL